jgi:3-vinyl bacteriochlorophyllide hydratase
MTEKISFLYTPEQKIKRDSSIWTTVQGVLAPLQFLVFLISLTLVLRFLFSGNGYEIANYSILIKTIFLLIIMVTGSIWEKVVFGKYLFAEAFFWEDVFSMLVISLHLAYVYSLFTGLLSPLNLMLLALAAYTAYLINAIQFIWKLRLARKQYAPHKSGLQHQSTDLYPKGLAS